MNYCCGFIFSESKDRVLLIQKLRPAWQAGKYNGIGGKIESFDKTPLDAMMREMREETTLWEANWKPVAELNFIDGLGDLHRIHFFALFNQNLNSILPLTDEKLFSISVRDIYDPETMYYHEVVPNLRYLIQIALNDDLLKNSDSAY